MITGGEIIKLVAEIAVAIVEDAVEQKEAKGHGEDDKHAIVEKCFWLRCVLHSAGFIRSDDRRRM
jgi:hypothetical protein